MESVTKAARFISFFAGIKSEPRYDVCSNSPHLRKYAYFGETRNPEFLSTTVYGNPMVALVSPLVSKPQLSPSRRFDSTPACDRQTDRQSRNNDKNIICPRPLRTPPIRLTDRERPGARLTRYLTTIIRLSYNNAKVTIDLRRTSNLQNILRRTQGFGFSSIRFTCKIVRSSETVFIKYRRRNFSTLQVIIVSRSYNKVKMISRPILSVFPALIVHSE